MNSLPTERKNFIILLTIFIFAIAIRTAGINSRPIWYDEAFAILFAEKGLSAMLYGTLTQTNAGSADIHPLGYYALLESWMNLFGTSIFSGRIFSILTSLGSLFLVYKIAKNLFNQKTALFATGILTILPFQIHFAQEIRMYSMLSFWLLLSTYSFLQAKTKGWKWWIVFSISSTLAQYTHNLAAIYLIPLSLTPIFHRDWKTLRNLILAGLVSLTLYIPWLIHLPAQLSKINSHYWVEKPGVEKIFTLTLFYLPHLPLLNPILLILGLLFALLIIAFAMFQNYLAIKNKTPNTNHALWLFYLSFTPPLLLWVISQFVPVYIERALLPAHAIFCIWLAWSLTETKAPKFIQSFVMIMILTCSVIGFYQHLSYKGFPYAEFNEINKSIESRFRDGDVIIHSSKLSYLPTFYFDSMLPQGFIIDPPSSSVDTLAPATREILELTEYIDIEQATINATRVWFIIYQNSIDEYILRSETNHPHLEYLNEHLTQVSMETWDGLQIFLYQKTTP